MTKTNQTAAPRRRESFFSENEWSRPPLRGGAPPIFFENKCTCRPKGRSTPAFFENEWYKPSASEAP
jgi:hypothetical protein